MDLRGKMGDGERRVELADRFRTCRACVGVVFGVGLNDTGSLEFRLNILPNKFLRALSSLAAEGACEPALESETALEAGLGPVGGINAPVDERDSCCFSSRMSTFDAAHTSTGSITARSINSIPLLANLAILASVPASTMIFVMTLWACKL